MIWYMDNNYKSGVVKLVSLKILLAHWDLQKYFLINTLYFILTLFLSIGFILKPVSWYVWYVQIDC